MDIVSSGCGSAQGFKTQKLSVAEYRSLFTTNEQLKFDKANSLIEGSFSWLTGGTVTIDQAATLVGLPSATYRDLLRTVCAAYNAAPADNGFSMDSKQVLFGLMVMELLGLLADTTTRRNTILQGLPL